MVGAPRHQGRINGKGRLLMADWQKLIDHLDAQGENQVRIEVEKISDIEGRDLPRGAWLGPTEKGLSDYWRTRAVLPRLEEHGWTVDFADYPKQVIGFRLLSETGQSFQAGSLAAEIQHLLSQVRRVGTVTSVAATKTLEDGTSITLSIDPSGQDRGDPQRPPSDQDRVDAPQEHPRTHRVSPERPIRRLPSIETRLDSIRYNDQKSIHWPISMSDAEDHQAFRRAVRRRVTDIEEGQGLGGYGCLATMSQKKSSQTKKPAIYSPVALGLRRVREEDALFDLVIQQKIAILSIRGHSHDEADSIRMEIKNRTGLTVRLLVPAHTVFEQDAPDPRAQDLMLRDPVEEMLAPSETKSIGAYGLCMDNGRASPSGEPLLLTPWILSTEAATQDELWAVTDPSP